MFLKAASFNEKFSLHFNIVYDLKPDWEDEFKDKKHSQ